MPLFRAEDMQEMCRIHAEHKADCTLMTAENPELTMWARMLKGPDGKFQRIVEGKDCTPEQAKIKELFTGVLVFNSKSLFEILPQISTNNVQHEYYLTEVPELMVQKGMKVETYHIQDGNDLRGVNTPEDMKVCEEILQERKKESLFWKQKELLDQFLSKGAITKAQYDKSFGDLREKMGMNEAIK